MRGKLPCWNWLPDTVPHFIFSTFLMNIEIQREKMTCSRKFGKQFSDVNHDPGFLLSSQYTFKYTRIKFGINMIVIKKWSGQNTWKGISYKKKTIWSQIIKDSNLIRDHGNAYIQQRDDSTHTQKTKKTLKTLNAGKKGPNNS